MAGDSLINKLPLAISVVVGGVTWLGLVFLFAAGLLGKIPLGKPAEIFLSQPTGGPTSGYCSPGGLEKVNIDLCSRSNTRMVTYSCVGGYQSKIYINCNMTESCKSWLNQIEKDCLKHPPVCPKSSPSIVPQPTFQPVKSPWPSPPVPTASPLACVGEGQTMPVYPGYSCCSGLIAIPPNAPDINGVCPTQPLVGASVCTKCGVGICGRGENLCNCQIDCLKPQASRVPTLQ